PRDTEDGKVTFTAYAFNVDGVKSATARMAYTIPNGLPPHKGRAYVITVGVNAYEDRRLDLRFAANDARQIQKQVGERLARTGRYEEVVPIELLSDYAPGDASRSPTVISATKENIKTVLRLLAGRPVTSEVKAKIPNADRIRPATPDDLILLSF